MAPELYILAGAVLLGFVHIFAAGGAKTKQYGTDWNMGARDEQLPPLEPLPGRLVRADANYRENFVLVAAVLLAVVVADKSGTLSLVGGLVWLGLRIVYLPIYAAGIKRVRSFVFLGSLIGAILILWQLLA